MSFALLSRFFDHQQARQTETDHQTNTIATNIKKEIGHQTNSVTCGERGKSGCPSCTEVEKHSLYDPKNQVFRIEIKKYLTVHQVKMNCLQAECPNIFKVTSCNL